MKIGIGVLLHQTDLYFLEYSIIVLDEFFKFVLKLKMDQIYHYLFDLFD